MKCPFSICLAFHLSVPVILEKTNFSLHASLRCSLSRCWRLVDFIVRNFEIEKIGVCCRAFKFRIRQGCVYVKAIPLPFPSHSKNFNHSIDNCNFEFLSPKWLTSKVTNVSARRICRSLVK